MDPQMYAKRFDVVSQLRGAKGNLARLMRPSCAFVDLRAVETNLTVDQLKCNELEIITRQVAPNVEAHFIRATFGHKLDVAQRIYFGHYVRYSGPNDIFCVTHTSQFGLAEINTGRQVNMLATPDITVSKGVVGYVSISQARLRGVEFYSKVGDRYNNKVVCFDTELKECFHNIVYADTYFGEESLIRTHANIISTLARFGVSQAIAIARVKRLIISDDEDNDADDEDTDNDEDDEDDNEELEKIRVSALRRDQELENMRAAFRSIVINA